MTNPKTLRDEAMEHVPMTEAQWDTYNSGFDQRKVCARCCQFKDRARFWKSRREPSGLQSWCIDCLADYRNRPEAAKRYDEKFIRISICGRRFRIPRERVDDLCSTIQDYVATLAPMETTDD